MRSMGVLELKFRTLWRILYYSGFGSVFGGGMGYAFLQMLKWAAPLVGLDAANLSWVLEATIALGALVGCYHAIATSSK